MIVRALESFLTQAVLHAPVTSLFTALSSAAPVVDGKRLDERTRYLLSMLDWVGPPPPNLLEPKAAREEYLRKAPVVAPPLQRLARVTDIAIRQQDHDITARVYVPYAQAGPLPALVYFHGGGWVLGSIATHDRLCRVLAAEAQCIVISVEYRLAPENKFPAAVDDAKAAFAWVVSETASLGADQRRIAVGGDSAGGNLAAVVALAGTSGEFQPPAHQLLVYPVTDLACNTRSYELYADGYFLTRDLMLWYREHYLRGDPDREDPRASPLLAELRKPLPPALVITAGFDPLLDEGFAYARKMRAAGTDVAYRCHESLIHGFISLAGALPAARAALSELTTALRLTFSRL